MTQHQQDTDTSPLWAIFTIALILLDVAAWLTDYSVAAKLAITGFILLFACALGYVATSDDYEEKPSDNYINH